MKKITTILKIWRKFFFTIWLIRCVKLCHYIAFNLVNDFFPTLIIIFFLFNNFRSKYFFFTLTDIKFLCHFLQLLDTLPVCQDFNRQLCNRPACKFIHLLDGKHYLTALFVIVIQKILHGSFSFTMSTNNPRKNPNSGKFLPKAQFASNSPKFICKLGQIAILRYFEQNSTNLIEIL